MAEYMNVLNLFVLNLEIKGFYIVVHTIQVIMYKRMDVMVADVFIILYETIFSFLLQLLVFVSKEVFFILSLRRFTLVYILF